MRKKYLEQKISEYLTRKHCFLVGRGSTAIYLALKAIERKIGKGEVILPTISCTSPAKAIYYAGFKPVFADVSLMDFTIDIESLRKKITKDTKCIIPIHIFGHYADMIKILEIARENNLYVIEDAAQAVGGKFKHGKIGSMGDFSILSFGERKVLDAGGGGALLTDHDDLAKIIKEEMGKLKNHNSNFYNYIFKVKSESYRNLYHSLIRLFQLGNNNLARNIFRKAITYFEDIYLLKFKEDRDILYRILKGFENLNINHRKRIERANLYNNLLIHRDIIRPKNWDTTGVIWRYTFLIKQTSKLKFVTDELRKNGIHASNLYWSVEDLFYENSSNKNTKYISPRILNLWVDDQVTKAHIRKSCNLILNCLEAS